jgi:CO dehydrogenase/acetyl-CoA synthase beta subunit
MAIFDEYIQKVKKYIEQIQATDILAQEFFCTGPADNIQGGLPIKVGPNANPGIILRGDMFIELGNPTIASKELFLWTDDLSLIENGRITLLGPDIPDSANASLPFAQIFMAGGKKFRKEDQETLEMGPHVADQIEGYMARSASGNLWSRVSNDAAKKGFSFEVLGKALMALFKSNVPDVQAMEVIFVTTSKEDVLGLDDIVGKVKNTRKEVVKESWKARGYDLDCDYDCSSCMDQSTCDDIRDVIAKKRKKDKESEKVKEE